MGSRARPRRRCSRRSSRCRRPSRGAVEKTRDLARGLRPVALDEFGLRSALTTLAAGVGGAQRAARAQRAGRRPAGARARARPRDLPDGAGVADERRAPRGGDGGGAVARRGQRQRRAVGRPTTGAAWPRARCTTSAAWAGCASGDVDRRAAGDLARPAGWNRSAPGGAGEHEHAPDDPRDHRRRPPADPDRDPQGARRRAGPEASWGRPPTGSRRRTSRCAKTWTWRSSTSRCRCAPGCRPRGSWPSAAPSCGS